MAAPDLGVQWPVGMGLAADNGLSPRALIAAPKISCRLVPDQEPEEIVAVVAEHLKRCCPPGLRLKVKAGSGAKAYAIPDEHPDLALAEEVLEEVYGQRALRVRMGATLPIGLIFRNAIAAETVFFSFSTVDEDYHPPDEFFRLQRLDDGFKAWNRYWQLLGEWGTTGLSTGRVV